MKVLVMGGTRFNGLALVHELVRHGHDVTIFNRGQTEATLPRGVRRLYGDRTDHDGMREVFAGSSTASRTSRPTPRPTSRAWSTSSAAAPVTTSSPARP